MLADDADPRLRVVLLSTHPQAPSFRHRLAPVMPALESMGYRCQLEVLPEQRYGWRIWQRRALLRSAAVVVLHKLRLPAWELDWLKRYCHATVFDVDDAIWTRQPKHIGHVRRPSPRRASRFDAMCRGATVVIAGNEVLAARARANTNDVLVIPTPVDAAAFPAAPPPRSGRLLVWIGMPGNAQYLALLRPILAGLAREFPGLALRVVSSVFPDWDDVPIERVPWSATTEAQALASADIGLMPLADDEFTRGKCAFKLLQYMAAGLPCVASPVGANREVVQPGVDGEWADTPQAWDSALRTLLTDPERRSRFGAMGRAKILAQYDTRVVVPRTVGAIVAVARGTPPWT